MRVRCYQHLPTCLLRPVFSVKPFQRAQPTRRRFRNTKQSPSAVTFQDFTDVVHTSPFVTGAIATTGEGRVLFL